VADITNPTCRLVEPLLLEGSAEYGMFENEYHNADDCHCDQICD
jgi:hypothetical protein